MSFFNNSLWIDEGYSNLTSLVIREKGIPLYESGHWDGSYLVFHYLQAGIFSLFGYNPEISRILPLILGIISLILVYKITRIVFENRLSAYVSVILTLASYQYLVSILQARYYSMMIFLFLITLYSILLFYKTQTVYRFFLTLNLIFFSIIFHVYLYSLLVVFILSIFILFIEKYVQVRKYLFNRKGLILLILVLVNAIAAYTFMVYVNPGQSTASVLNTALLAKFDYAVRYAWFFRSEFGILGVLLFATLVTWQKFKNKKMVLILLFSLFFPYLVIAKQVFMYANRYVYFLIPIFIILSVGFIGYSISYLKNRYYQGFLLIFYIIGIGLTFHTWIGSTFPLSMNDRFAPEPDYKSAYSFIQNKFKTNTGYSLISSFPHMDKLYISKSDGYIYIDETGTGILPEKNFYIKNRKNIFTNAPVILAPDDLKRYENGPTVIVLDQLSYNRLLNSDILTYIEKNYSKIFEKNDGNYFVKVYYLDISVKY